MDKTKHSFTIAFVFLAFLWSGDRALSYGLTRLVSLSHNRFISMYMGRGHGEIVVIGNSRADRHFPPDKIRKLTGKTAVNLGLGGISTVLSEALLRDYIDRYGTPQLLIVEPTNLMADPNTIGDMRLFGIYSERIESLLKQSEPELYYAARAFNLFGFNNDMAVRVLYGVFTHQSDRRFRSVIPATLVEETERAPMTTLSSFPGNEKALESIAQLAAQKGIRMEVIITPYLPEYRKKIGNFDIWLKNLRQLAGRNANVWDFSDASNETTDFRDRLHLNSTGVDTLLGKMMRDKILKPDM